MSDKTKLNGAERAVESIEVRRYPAYPSYRPSGSELIGDVPEHWEVRKLKFVSRVQNSNVDKKSHEDEEAVQLCNYVDVYCTFL